MAFELALPHTRIPAANWQRGVGPQQKLWIVIHCMQWPEKLDSAEWCGRFFAGTLDPGKDGKRPAAPRASAHYCVDSNSIVECLAPELIAWHAAGGNREGIGVEHAGYHRQTARQWLDPYGIQMLTLSARLVAELCLHFDIPTEFVDRTDLRARLKGITTHAEVTHAFGKSTHLDPGPGFPMREYLDLVRKHTDGSRLEA